jgi:intracellular septation protein
MMIPIRLPNIANALQSRLVADMAAERVAGIGGIDDHPSPAQNLDGLAYEAPLRGHGMQLQVDTHFVGYDTRMNQLLEWLPLIVFFVGFKLLGIYWATAALMIACVLQLTVHRFRTGKFKPMHIITVAVVLVLGSATLLLHDRRFIQWKPTVLLALAAAAFLGSMFIGKQPLARRLLEAVFNEPLPVSPRTWLLINSLWVGWLALLAAANIYVAWNFDESIWVNFKVFGITVAMLIFMMPQILWLSGKTKTAQSERG